VYVGVAQSKAGPERKLETLPKKITKGKIYVYISNVIKYINVNVLNLITYFI
jgi:hypothetical protein